MNANECLILDDDELEITQRKPVENINPRDMRSWLPETLHHTNPFNSTYVSTSHSFPKVFQMKGAGQKEEFPKLSDRIVSIPATTMNYRSRLLQKPQQQQNEKVSTINVLERVREVLQDVSGAEVQNSLMKCRTCGGGHWTLSCEQEKVEEKSPPYSPHTPPYPFDSPVMLISSPPINEILYPIGTPVYPSTPS